MNERRYAHRLTEEQINSLAAGAGFTKVTDTRLQNLVLYCLEG